MRTRVPELVAAALVLTAASSAHGGWNALTSGTTNPLFDVHFPIDDQTGYLVGQTGYLHKTTDGGQNWADVGNGTTESLTGVHFTDNQNGVVVGNNLTILRTTNGGSSWTTPSAPAGLHFNAVAFADASTGYIAGNSGTILKTTDGGANWTDVSPAGYGTSQFQSVDAVDANTVFICGTGSGKVMKTINGGTSWTNITDVGEMSTVYGVSFLDANTGFASDSISRIHKTTDGGTSWTYVEVGNDPIVYAVQAVTATTIYAGATHGVIFNSSDAGTTFGRQYPMHDQNIRGVHFVDATTGYACGANGALFKTTDGGGTYQVALHPTGPGSVNGFTSETGCAAGAHDGCVNDQNPVAGSGIPDYEDGETTYLLDGNGQTNREMFSLDDGLIPAGAKVTGITVRAHMGKGSGPSKYVSLSYQRVPSDAVYIDGSSQLISEATCCVQFIEESWTGLDWSPSDIDELQVGLVHNSGGQIKVSQLYVVVTYEDAVAEISSDSNQVFGVGDPTTAISPINVSDGAVPVINFIDDIRITIPAGFSMTWDTSDTTATVSGGAASKVSSTVSYEDSGRTLVIDVTTSFAAGESIDVSGLSFTGFSTTSSVDNLEYDFDNVNPADGTDDKTIQIGPSGTIYHVRKTGDDAADGLSKGTAWQTIDKAANTMVAGDWVYVGAGLYDEQVTPTNDGTATDPIRFIADTDGSRTDDAGTVEITHSDSATDVVLIEDDDYIEIVGFKISGGDEGIVWLNSIGGLVDQCDIDTPGDRGISVETGAELTVTNSLVHGCGNEGIYAWGGATLTVTDTDSYSNSKFGFRVVDAATTLVASRCRIYDNTGDGMRIEAGNVTLINCLVKGSTDKGLYVIPGPATTTLWHCTIVSNQHDGFKQDSGTGVIRNCIIANNNQAAIELVGGTVDHTYNLFWNNTDGLLGTIQHITEDEADPVFVSATDWHLQSSSPAINAGTDASGVTTIDYDGDARPGGGGWDMGFDEQGGSSPSSPRIVKWTEIEP